MQQREQLTQREKQIYNFIVEFRRQKHFSPSMRKIANGIGLNSVSTISVHVHKMVKKGWFLPYDGSHNAIIPISDSII